MSVMMVQAKCKLTTLTYSSNCSIFSAKKLEIKSTTKKQESLKKGKLRFRLNIDVRKEKEDSWLNAINTKIAFVKRRTESYQQEYNSSQCFPYGISFKGFLHEKTRTSASFIPA